MAEFKHYSLIHEEPIRDKPPEGEEYGDIIDWKFTVVAESKTVRGLLRFAQMKRLDKNNHTIEANYTEYINGIPVPDSKQLGHLNEMI